MENTSKQALEHIKHMANWEYYNIQEDIPSIEKDLDVLEILKKWIVVNETYDDLFPYEIKVKQGYVSNKSCLTLTEEDFKKIKEWLENE